MNFAVLSSSATSDSGAELRMAAARMYRHGTMEASGGGSKGLWVERNLKKIPDLSFGTEE